MRKTASLLLSAAAALVLASHGAAAQGLGCFPADEVLKSLTEDYKEKIVWAGNFKAAYAPDGVSTVMVFQGEGGSWTMITPGQKPGTLCLINTGQGGTAKVEAHGTAL